MAGFERLNQEFKQKYDKLKLVAKHSYFFNLPPNGLHAAMIQVA